jgi:hypothetical protein
MIGYESDTAHMSKPSGFPKLPHVSGHVITVEMVNEALNDE